MTDADIKVGDVCIDLVKRGKVQVVGQPAPSVGAHQDQNDYDIAQYKANALLDVSRPEPVFSVVYLPDEPSTSFSGTYDFPASRLARVPVEEANDDLRRHQHDLAVGVLEAVFDAMHRGGMFSEDDIDALAHHTGLPEDLVDEARELAEVEEQFGDGEDDA